MLNTLLIKIIFFLLFIQKIKSDIKEIEYLGKKIFSEVNSKDKIIKAYINTSKIPKKENIYLAIKFDSPISLEYAKYLFSENIKNEKVQYKSISEFIISTTNIIHIKLNCKIKRKSSWKKFLLLEIKFRHWDEGEIIIESTSKKDYVSRKNIFRIFRIFVMIFILFLSIYFLVPFLKRVITNSYINRRKHNSNIPVELNIESSQVSQNNNISQRQNGSNEYVRQKNEKDSDIVSGNSLFFENEKKK